ncbi:MAG TPA: sulfate ABC transporter permease subunit CysT [Polyangia bacterium]
MAVFTSAGGGAAPAHGRPLARRRRAFATGILPGFGLSLGYTVAYLSLIVLIPLGGLAVKSAGLTGSEFLTAVASPRALAAYRLTFLAALAAGVANVVFGIIVAWVLVRYRFPGRAVFDALVDLPFALPTAVAGIALTALYADNGWIGRWLAKLDIHVAYSPAGVSLAMLFVGLPFVVRTVEPILLDLDPQIEEAAATLGASRRQTMARVILPVLLPPALTGFALAFARGLGEYGSIVFISGNMPMKTEIVPLLIVTKLEQYDYAGATAIALVMLLASFALLFLINTLQAFLNRRGAR